jgi:hypothetical protein
MSQEQAVVSLRCYVVGVWAAALLMWEGCPKYVILALIVKLIWLCDKMLLLNA